MAHQIKRVHPLKSFMRSELEQRFKAIDGGVVVAIRGLNSEKTYDLRAKLQGKGVKLHCVKNAVAVRAFKAMGYEEAKLLKVFEGPVGIIYSKAGGAGVVGAVKALNAWKDANKDAPLAVKGGFMEGAVIDAAGVKVLQDLPSRDQLLAMVAGAFQAPIGAVANRLHECMAKFAYAIDAVKDKKEKAGEK